MSSILRKHFNTIWLALVAVFLLLLFLFPGWINPGSIANFLNGLGAISLLVYVLLSLSRALLMIPSTPFVLGGAIAFPDMPLVVWLISASGVVVGALLVYSFPSFGSYDRFLEEKYPDKILFLKEKMKGEYAFWITYKKMIVPLLIGQLPLATVYIFLGTEFGEWLRI